LTISVHAKEGCRSNTTSLANNHTKKTTVKPMTVNNLRKLLLDLAELHTLDWTIFGSNVKRSDIILSKERYVS
tara:strand:+ start:291 stop:509 length:219 start_codon:yes stop_codon:yes gene_type:complete